MNASSYGRPVEPPKSKQTAGLPPLDRLGARSTTPEESSRANRRWWDASADDYQAEHGRFLRDVGFLWCPERLDEAEVALLGPVAGRRVLEVGCGAAHCSRWLVTQGASVAAFDISRRQLEHGVAASDRSGVSVALVQADACQVPFLDASFDLACSAFGAVSFVASPDAVMREVFRVLRPGGRWVFSVNHPMTWMLPDDPGPAGLTVKGSYFDPLPYLELDAQGEAIYAEHHRTMGQRVRDIVAAGFRLTDVVEPEWPEGHSRIWGQWSPLRGRHLPGTAIFICDKP